ncbi:DNA polymerase III subunit chi [Methylocystis echinoides]|jgi:DNA polymerase-3 subunit chi|uniref:DNA polymerase III subunit chi n=1 Tax=Methylocystis echinoides TaxID=29468 RepID=UPI00342E9863
MVEISFFHLKTRRVEDALPTLLERSLSRGWRVAVQAASEARMRALDDHLWAYRPESFLPHGTRADASPETQPIYLTTTAENPNAADVRIFLEGVRIAPCLESAAAPRLRAVLLFDGDAPDELENARDQWRELRDAGQTLVYQQQDESGRWVEKAREPKAAS